MAIKIGINGFGRIGKLVFRAAQESKGAFEVVAINDLMTTAQLAHAMKYDSTQGRFEGQVSAAEDSVSVNGKKIRVTAIKDPTQLKWNAAGADMVLESTGVFAQDEQVKMHVTAGAKKVLLSVPPKSKPSEIRVIVMGVNDDTLKPADALVSNASCTTNCLAPVAKVLHEKFGIVKGLMTTVHGYTNDQNILDQVHKDPRRARAGAVNIIPTTTGAARAVGIVLPDLNGKLDGFALRVPVPTGSCVDLVAEVKTETSIEAVNAAVKAASEGALKGILGYTEDPIVSSDIVHDARSSIFDAKSTMVKGNMVKIVSWYDNEWGYSNRCLDLFKKMAG